MKGFIGMVCLNVICFAWFAASVLGLLSRNFSQWFLKSHSPKYKTQDQLESFRDIDCTCFSSSSQLPLLSLSTFSCYRNPTQNFDQRNNVLVCLIIQILLCDPVLLPHLSSYVFEVPYYVRSRSVLIDIEKQFKHQ